MNTASKPANSLMRELKRRKVFRTCGYYIVVCCALLFLAGRVLPALGVAGSELPDLLLGIAIVGLPVAALCAWFFQITSEGVTRTTSFVERRVLKNMAPINDKRYGGQSAQDQPLDYRWVITAESGPLKGLSYGVLDTIVVGRSLENDLALVSPEVSRQHARFELEGDQLFVEDLNSTLGTLVNGERTAGRQVLNSGDEVRFHDIAFRISTGSVI